jgi:dTMP kinase
MSLFVVIEGIDGSGKSTLVSNLEISLQRLGISVRKFSEPTSFETGRYIRKFLSGEISLSKKEQLDAFIQDRKLSLEKNILPSLKNGAVVLLDRYFYSTAAYQSGEEFSAREILKMNLAEKFPMPDLLFFMDIHPEETKFRIESRNSGKEVFDSFDIQKKIYSAFMEILPPDTIKLDSKKSIQLVKEEALANIIKYLT